MRAYVGSGTFVRRLADTGGVTVITCDLSVSVFSFQFEATATDQALDDRATTATRPRPWKAGYSSRGDGRRGGFNGSRINLARPEATTKHDNRGQVTVVRRVQEGQ